VTVKQTYNPEGLREFIEQRATHTHGGHLVYTGPATVQCDFKEMAVSRAYYLLSGHTIPPGKFLLKTCGQLNCIEPESWSVSHSPHSVAKPPVPKSLKRLRAALVAALAALDELEAE